MRRRSERDRFWKWGVAALVACLAAAFSAEVLAAEAVRVERALDGDTVVVRTGDRRLRVRLLGADTPELARDARPAEPFAEAARQFTSETLSEARSVALEVAGDRIDAYGRTLGFLWVAPASGGPPLNLSEELVRQGLARAVRGFDYPGKIRFLEAEREARRRGRGLWRR